MRIQLIVLCLSAFFDLSMATNTSSNHNESTTTKDPQEDRNMNINQEESILYRQLRSDRGREQRRHKQNYKKTYKREQDNDGDDGDYKMKIKNKKKNKKCGRNANGYVEQYPSRTDIEDVRFSKGAIDLPEIGNGIFPLSKSDFPLSDRLGRILRQTNCDSVILPTDFSVNYDVKDMAKITNAPAYPSRNNGENDEYFRELNYVIDVQRMRKLGMSAEILMPVPKHWKGFSLEDAANAVHSEYPNLHQSTVIADLMTEGVQIDKDIIHQSSRVDFVKSITAAAALNQFAFEHVSANTFALKYYFGLPRPEEMVYRIYKEEYGLKDGVPKSTFARIRKLDLECMEEFTAYSEGAPKHPSYPAMHSSASALSLFMPVIFDLTDEQFFQTKVVDYAVAMARTAAGVHYEMDNLSGLVLGQELVARALPDYLASKYGSDREAVKRKIQKYRFDWFKFHKFVKKTRVRYGYLSQYNTKQLY